MTRFPAQLEEKKTGTKGARGTTTPFLENRVAEVIRFDGGGRTAAGRREVDAPPFPIFFLLLSPS